VFSVFSVLHSLAYSSSYAADGDRDEILSSDQHPERKSRLGEAEKLRLLEQEVLNYPGHVIYVTFEHKSYDVVKV